MSNPKVVETCVYNDEQGFKVFLRPDGKFYADGLGYGTFRPKDSLEEAKELSTRYYEWSSAMDAN